MNIQKGSFDQIYRELYEGKLPLSVIVKETKNVYDIEYQKIINKQSKMNNLINIATGEDISDNPDDEQITEALKIAEMELKRLEQIIDALKKEVLDRLSPDQKEFGGFFQIRHQNRKLVDVQKLPQSIRQVYESHKNSIREIEEKFGKDKEIVSIYFPKFI